MHVLQVLQVPCRDKYEVCRNRLRLHQSARAHLALPGYRKSLLLQRGEQLLLGPWLEVRDLVYEQNAFVGLVHSACLDPEVRRSAETARVVRKDEIYKIVSGLSCHIVYKSIILFNFGL